MMVSCRLLWDQACSDTMSNNRVSVKRFQRDVFFSKTEAIYKYNYILKRGKTNCLYIYIQDWSPIIISRINYTNCFYIYIQDWSTIIISRINYRINLILRTAHADKNIN